MVNRPFHQEKRSSYLRAFTGRFVVNLFGCIREVSKLLHGMQLSFETSFSLIVGNNDYFFEPNLFGIEREKHSLPVFPFCFIGTPRSGSIILIDFVLPKLLLTRCLEKQNHDILYFRLFGGGSGLFQDLRILHFEGKA